MAVYHDEMLDLFLRDSGLPYLHSVLPGHTRVRVSVLGTLLGAAAHHVAFRRVEYYYFGFDRTGVTLRQHENGAFFGPLARLPWGELSRVRFAHGPLETRFSFRYRGEDFHMMLLRRMAGQPWVGENWGELRERGFFCPDTSRE